MSDQYNFDVFYTSRFKLIAAGDRTGLAILKSLEQQKLASLIIGVQERLGNNKGRVVVFDDTRPEGYVTEGAWIGFKQRSEEYYQRIGYRLYDLVTELQRSPEYSANTGQRK